MRLSHMTISRAAEICARLIKQESLASIKRSTRASDSTIRKAARALRENGIELETREPLRLNPVREERLHELFRTTSFSNRAIQAATGINLTAVNKSRIRFNAAVLQSGGELPRCDCGQDLHHPRMCWARHRKGMAERGVISVQTLSADDRADVRRRLLRGETLRSIGERVGLQRALIAAFLRTFTPEERARRQDCFVVQAARRRSEACTKRIANPYSTNPLADPMYAQIAREVPRGIDAALRDDMIMEAYVEYLEKKLDPTRVREGVKKVRSRIFRQFANPWGHVSLDAVTSDDGGRAMVERIPADASAFV